MPQTSRTKLNMHYQRLFYSNITYSCNNNCKHCISHNTNNIYKENLSLETLKNINYKTNFCAEDIFVINGGEPTLVAELPDIIDFLSSRDVKVIIYTNGRLIRQIEKLKHNRKFRFIIPFYGLRNTHDFQTGILGSFEETFASLTSIKNHENVDIKILLHKDLSETEFLHMVDLLSPFCNSFNLSCIFENSNILERCLSVEQLVFGIKKISLKKNLKFSNIPLCKLGELTNSLKNNELKIREDTINDYFFIGTDRIKKMNYDKLHLWFPECENCNMHNFCCDNNIRYRVLSLKNNNFSLEIE